jgi:hypothetical protein
VHIGYLRRSCASGSSAFWNSPSNVRTPIHSTNLGRPGRISAKYSQKTGYLHFELWNCGNNVPQIVGNPFAIVAQQFDIRPNPTTGLISSAVYGKDQILCGNVASTEWLVTEFKASGKPAGNPQYYCLTSVFGGGTPFDPSSTQPCQVTPPPPGFSWVLGNSLQSQSITQPAGTVLNISGSLNLNGSQVCTFAQCAGYHTRTGGMGRWIKSGAQNGAQ